MKARMLAMAQSVVKWLAIRAGLRAVSVESLEKLREDVERLRPLEHMHRKDWVLVATGGMFGGTFTPAPIEHTAIVPKWVDGRPERSRRAFATPDPWEPYQDFAEALIPDDPNVTSAVLLTHDQAMMLGYRPWSPPVDPARRHLSLVGE